MKNELELELVDIEVSETNEDKIKKLLSKLDLILDLVTKKKQKMAI